jgi:hypothetical protein
MYEKAGELDKSLLDINEVLSRDVFHIKARTRRGRLYEAQVSDDNIPIDYAVMMLI